jgi:hypothetical protein
MTGIGALRGLGIIDRIELDDDGSRTSLCGDHAVLLGLSNNVGRALGPRISYTSRTAHT